jgi:hypothetical protein
MVDGLPGGLELIAVARLKPSADATKPGSAGYSILF